MLNSILVIDDEVDILDIVADQIEILGYTCEVLKAQSTEEAEKLIDRCDAIISDVKMPNSARIEELLRSSKKPVARITGHDDFQGDLIIRKPFEVKGFKEVMDKLNFLAKKHQKPELQFG